MNLTAVRWAGHPIRKAAWPSSWSTGLAGKALLVLLWAIPLLGLVGCDRSPTVPTDAVLSIDGEEIPYSHFETYLRRQVDEEVSNLDTAALSALFDQFLEGELLIRLAIERGLVEGEVDEGRAVGYLLRDLRYEPSPAEVDAFYQSRLSEFERPEQVRLRQILVDEAELADQALEALESESFESVAARFSQGPTAHLGGDHGVLARADLPTQLADLVFGLGPGEVSEVVEADYGFQIFQVVEHFPSEVISLEEALPSIRQELAQRHASEQTALLRQEARERYNVTVFHPNIPFDYQGSHGQTQDAR